jgi:hypothetical protein
VHFGQRGRLSPPVQHQLVVQVGEQPLGARPDHLPLSVAEHRVRLGEQVEDGEFCFGQILDDRPAFLRTEVPGQRDEPAQVLVDVDTAGVVLGDQLLDPLDQVEPGRVAPGRSHRPLLEQRGEPVGLGPFATGEAGRQCVDIDLGQVDERIRFDAFGGGADHVLLRTHRPVEQRVDRVGDFRDVGGVRTRQVDDALSQHADDRNHRLRGGGGRVGQHRLEQLARPAGGSEELGAYLLIDQQRLAASRNAIKVKPDAARSSSRSTSYRAHTSTAASTASKSATTSSPLPWIGGSTPASAFAAP